MDIKPYDLLKCIYYKTKPASLKIELGHCLVLTKWLSMNPACAGIVRDLMPCMLYMNPVTFFYLLYMSIPKGQMVFNKLPAKEDLELDPLIARIKSLFGWSSKELNLNSKIIEKTILSKRDYWLSELGV